MKSITAVRPGDRFDHWHNVTCRDYSVTECGPVPDRRFRGEISIKEFGALAVSAISTTTEAENAIRVARRHADIRKDPRDHFMLWLMLGGRVGLATAGRAERMRAGDLFVYDQSLPFVLEFGREVRALTVTIPRPLLAARMPLASQSAGRRIAGDSGLGKLAGTLVQELYRLEDTTCDAVATRLGASVLDILATVLEANLPSTGGGGPGRLAEVKRYILAHLHDPHLNLSKIATAQAAAPRTLYRLFADEGTTPMRWLWQQRLAAGFRMLAEGQAERVTEVALSVGFSDVSHFSRAFKAAFGYSPRALRRADAPERRWPPARGTP